MRHGLLFAGLLCLSVARAEEGGLDSLRQTGKAFSGVAKKVAPSVVFIQVEGQAEDEAAGRGAWPFQDDLFRRFFGQDSGALRGFGAPARPMPRKPRTRIDQGSGFVFSQAAGVSYILTNHHVVEGGERITVRFQDGREYQARLKGADAKSDVAVLEIAARGLPALKWGDSARLEVGEWVVAMGNPFGLSHTLTTGVVSAKGRTSLGINDYEDFIQTDAAINPGNSGGPLVNLEGEVVGMNTAIFSRSGGYMGVGFAIPSNLARIIAEQLVVEGKVVRGYLGLTVQPLSAELAEAMRIDARQGVLVSQVDAGSPAEHAGLRAGDVLTHFDGTPLSEGGQYRNHAALARPGASVNLSVLREGRRLELPVRAARLDEEALQGAEATRALGVTVRALTPEEAGRLGIDGALLVTAVEPGSLATLAGMAPGSLILEANRKPVGTPGEFAALLGASGGSVLLRLYDNGRSRTITLRWR